MKIKSYQTYSVKNEMRYYATCINVNEKMFGEKMVCKKYYEL